MKPLLTESYYNSQSRGVSIFIKKKKKKKGLKYTIIDVHNDNDGRILLINLEIDENIFTLMNLYANNVEKNRNAFFKKVNNFIENLLCNRYFNSGRGFKWYSYRCR